MPTISIEKVENGYILSHGIKKFVQPGFAEVISVLAAAFDEQAFVMHKSESESNVPLIRANKRGRPTKKGNNG